jgi:hypothetical protein
VPRVVALPSAGVTFEKSFIRRAAAPVVELKKPACRGSPVPKAPSGTGADLDRP